MSLLDQYKEKFVIMEKTELPDGEGGKHTEWRDGAEIDIIVNHNATLEARIAEANTTTNNYDLYFNKNIVLKYNDVVKRLRDGQTFKITQPSGEDITPQMSRLNLTKVTARKWEVGT